MIQLTDEEIQSIHGSLYEDGKTPEAGWFEHCIAKAQLKKVISWLEDECGIVLRCGDTNNKYPTTQIVDVNKGKWQALLKEIE